MRDYDITRDGTRFLIPGTPDNKPVEVTRLNLVQNSFHELRRLAPPSQQQVASGTAVTRLQKITTI